MSELFVELFSEEIPARLQINARNELKKNIKNFFIANQIKFNENFNVYSNKYISYFMSLVLCLISLLILIRAFYEYF